MEKVILYHGSRGGIVGILINKTESTTARYYISRDFPKLDNFRIRLEGYGPVQIFDMAWRMERSEAGH